MATHANISYVPPSERNKRLLNRLAELWEASVRATHHFLQETDIAKLKPCVTAGLASIRHLYVAFDADAPTAEITHIPEQFFTVTIKELPDENFGIGGKSIDEIKRNYK